MDIGNQQRVIVVEPLRLDPEPSSQPSREPTRVEEPDGAVGTPETVPTPADDTT